MKNIFNKISYAFIALAMVSCHNDLDQSPIDPDSFTEEDVYANADEAKSALAKLYAGFAVTGQQGPAGNPDLDPNDIDEGFSQFTRTLFYLNELTTDHAVLGWGDAGVADMHGMYWTDSNDFTNAMYNRLGQEVSFCNSFIENAGQLSDAEVQTFIAEARFLRAYAYYNLMDLYGNVPIQTTVATTLPTQNSRQEVFNFIEAELLEVKDLLPASGANEYGRVDRVAAWALLSRLYLNAEVYINENRYNDCITYCNEVMNSSYSLNMSDGNGNGTAYDELFLADNDSNGAQNEFIFALNFDGVQTQTYGGTTFLVHAQIGGSMVPADYGVDSGWAGLRVTSSLVNNFEDGDMRAMFYTDGQSLEIEDISQFSNGYAVTKFKNIDTNGNPGVGSGQDLRTDNDLPLIRLAEIYLNYAEATLRGGNGDMATAVQKVNEIRTRAFGGNTGNITSSNLTLDFVLHERSRELYWELLRRTDLIRYNQFTTGSYLWPWKGDQPNGISVDSYRNLFPIPNNNLATNPNLTQNPGY
ncbi:RagB/SusD family nutrient uptake outer membrane protein [Mangrovimonas sp. YM274]|uniref:RagB/SusD family nutrient uptake outer membrane protein n=1 Tax=Mangrovimonas sp. YM274 TaxID=3070660 RepID=UPI0027DBA153|nr:RagB/SusD family nutrient uptake outer membrane protein [Mangrovimonas sp. YM274]WMI68551.1 RagB/SusD family nutrient uptake outer membrane protein [Mangrovimonas sp. YM274]